MQIIPRYLVSNRVNIIADVAGFITEYRPVYQRHIKIYKGIDNVLEFKVLNSDQKPVDISGYTPKFQAFDENKNLVIEHDGTQVTPDGSTIIKGLFKITVTQQDLLNLKDQYLSYNIHLTDVNNNALLTYTDTHFGMNGTIFVSSEAMPGPSETKELTFIEAQEVNGEFILDGIIDAQPGINGNEALHTIAVYSDGLAGTLTVEATLDNQTSSQTAWAAVASLSLSGNETSPVPLNFNGVYSWLRFKTSALPSENFKILVRN